MLSQTKEAQETCRFVGSDATGPSAVSVLEPVGAHVVRLELKLEQSLSPSRPPSAQHRQNSIAAPLWAGHERRLHNDRLAQRINRTGHHCSSTSHSRQTSSYSARCLPRGAMLFGHMDKKLVGHGDSPDAEELLTVHRLLQRDARYHHHLPPSSPRYVVFSAV